MSTTNTFVLQQPFRHRIYSPTTSSPISSLYIKLKNNPYQRQQQMAANSMNIASSVTTTPPLPPPPPPPPPPSSNVIGEILGDVSIFTASGEPVLFKHLWDQKQGMAVVALLRHFGCPCSWELASALEDSKERFEAAGVKLIAVGVGTPDKAQMLVERLPFPMDSLYCDPDHKAYDVLGLYYGLGRTFFNPASVKVLTRFASLKQAVKNYTIKATPEDRNGVLQQGGMFVFKGNELLYSRKDKGTGDHAPLNEILDLCCTVTVT